MKAVWIIGAPKCGCWLCWAVWAEQGHGKQEGAGRRAGPPLWAPALSEEGAPMRVSGASFTLLLERSPALLPRWG